MGTQFWCWDLLASEDQPEMGG